MKKKIQSHLQCVSTMGVGRYFSRRGEVDILLIFFRLLRMQCKWTFTKRFTVSTSQRKCPMERQQSRKMRFVGSNTSFSLMLLFTAYRTTGLSLSAVVVSLHYLTSCHTCLRSTATCGKKPISVTFLSEPSLPCDCYAIKTNIRTFAPKFHNLSLQAMEWITGATPGDFSLDLVIFHRSQLISCLFSKKISCLFSNFSALF